MRTVGECFSVIKAAGQRVRESKVEALLVFLEETWKMTVEGGRALHVSARTKIATVIALLLNHCLGLEDDIKTRGWDFSFPVSGAGFGEWKGGLLNFVLGKEGEWRRVACCAVSSKEEQAALSPVKSVAYYWGGGDGALE